MAAFSNTSFSINSFSPDAFDFGPTTRPSGGFPAYQGERRPKKEQIRRARIAHGIIVEVAKRQAEALTLDDIQKQQELREELRLRGIEAEIADFRELARIREKLIGEEIALRMKIMLDDQAALIIMLSAI